MKFSLNLLNNYVDLSDLTHEEIASLLTNAGIEVESITPLAIGSNLVVGEILSKEQHPDAKTLSVLQVDLGPKYGSEQIVCGAPNCAVGQKVIVARVGAKLANDLLIGAANLRGVTSNGMVCSLSELGVNPEFLTKTQLEGIEVLSDEAIVGDEDVLNYLRLDDAILHLDLLANRPDASAAIPLALELQGLLGRKKDIVLPTVKETFKTNASVEIKTDLCPQFAIMEVSGIKNGESPLWLKNYLMASGIRSINKVVDIGNFVMILTGQPLHLYDASKVPSPKFVIKDDVIDPKFLALDEHKYDVKAGDISITSNNEIMCLGGIMGAFNSEVQLDTTRIYIESAVFDQATIRRSALRLGLMSDSSQRFAKGVNPHQATEVINLAAALLKQLCEADEFSNIVNVDNVDHTPQVIEATYDYINRRLGTSFSNEQINNALEAVNIKVTQLDEVNFKATIPPYRLDFSGPADLSEEVIRILGFESINIADLPYGAITLGKRSEKAQKEKLIRNHLLAQGLHEALTYSLTEKENQSKFAYLNKGEPYTIINPLTPLREQMRLNSLYGLIESARYNYARQLSDFGLFEISDVYKKDGEIQKQLAVILVGQVDEHGKLKQSEASFYHVKGLFESIRELFNLAASRFKLTTFSQSENELHPYRSGEIYANNRLIGVLGELHPTAKNELDFAKTPVSVLTLNLTELLKMKTSTIKASDIAKYPFVKRDLAIVVKKEVESGAIIHTIRRSAQKIVHAVDIFDVYEGEHVASDEKSLAFSLTFGDYEKTLTDHEINVAMENIMNELNTRYGARRRS